MGVDIITGAQVVAPALNRFIIASFKKGKKGEGEKPTDDPGYNETLDLMRKLFHFCALSCVEDVQSATQGWMPATPSCIVTDVKIPKRFNGLAAQHVTANLGPANLNRVGKTWWQWRKLGSVVRAEWVEMKNDFVERNERNDPGKKVMFYVHGGAYYLGGIGHGFQIQRHARKLKGRVFAPRYRLAPQFPFPCALQDVLAAYLYLLTIQDAKHIVIAGDSAGGGLCVALMIILRDQGLPMPAGASLISPWVDLTHSFPSITIPTEFDYVPVNGFHAKPNLSWPPPTSDEMRALGYKVNPDQEPDYVVEIDHQPHVLRDQFQMYAANSHLQIPLVSPICAASLGGFCPVQVISGGGEVLRDEQMYLAHKMADPGRYAPCEEILTKNGNTMEDVYRHPPTDVQLLSFQDGAHVQPILAHTNIAKYQYRSIAQFATWALEKAQESDINIDETRSEDSSHYSDSRTNSTDIAAGVIGKAGDALPPFVDHMIRHKVDRNGNLFPHEPVDQLRCCNIPASEIGFPKALALQGFLERREKLNIKYATQRKKVFDQRQQNAKKGYITFPDDEFVPPSALAGRRVIGAEEEVEKPRGKVGSAMIRIIFNRLEE